MSAVVGEWPAWNPCQWEITVDSDFLSNESIKWLELDIMDHDGCREEEDLAATPRRSRRRHERLRRQSEADKDEPLILSGETMGARPRAKRPRELGLQRILQGDSGSIVTTVTPNEEMSTDRLSMSQGGDVISDINVVDSFTPVNVPSQTSSSEDPGSPTILVPNGKSYVNCQGPLKKG